VITVAAVEKHITRIFDKLEIDPVESEHRRVHAVLKFLARADRRSCANHRFCVTPAHIAPLQHGRHERNHQQHLKHHGRRRARRSAA
jgi:hypothetical protein